MATGSPDRVLTEMLARHGAELRRYGVRLVGDEQDALDVTQNVWLRVLVALRRGERPRHERAWLRRITHNEAMSLLRARREVRQLDEQLVDARAEPATATLAHEHLEEVIRDVRALRPRARRILLMTALDDRDRAEVADRLAISAGAVSQSLWHTRASLRATATARETDCAVIRSSLEEPDGRRRRTRLVAAHARACAACRTFARHAAA